MCRRHGGRRTRSTTSRAVLAQRDILLSGQSNARDTIVPAFAAGHSLARAAYGGTDLVEWAVDGNLFNLAMAACNGKVISEIWWIQGESDAATADYASAYQARLVTLLAGFRARLGVNVRARIGLLNSAGGAPFTATVRQAQINVCDADPLSFPFDMNAFTSFGFDGTHYSNPAGYTAIGNALTAAAGGLL